MASQESLQELGRKRLRQFQQKAKKAASGTTTSSSNASSSSSSSLLIQDDRPLIVIPSVIPSVTSLEPSRPIPSRTPQPRPETDRHYISILLEEKADLLQKTIHQDSKITALTADLSSLQTSHQNLLSSNVALATTLQDLESRFDQLLNDKNDAVEALSALEARYDALAAQPQKSSDGPYDTATVAQELQIQSLSNKIDDLSRELSHRDQLLVQAETEKQENLTRINDLVTEITNLTTQLTSQTLLHDRAIEESKLSHQSLTESHTEAITSLTTTITSLELQITSLNTHIATLDASRNDLLETRDAALLKGDVLYKRVAALQGENTQLVEQLGELRTRVVHLSNQLAEAQDTIYEERKKVKASEGKLEGYQKAMEVVNQIQTQSPITPTPLTPVDLVSTLRTMELHLQTLTQENTALKASLAEEKKLTTLLAAEVQCLPDYIQLYHNERQRLK
ncbi:hypothetical protein BC829DRAFT_393655 [Chytridium lagenaria]|nr:hypothetical protein BC829DRAFT_393655 [Chytridium lagenaria]